MKPLILGTRGSDLALAQARLVREALEIAHPGIVIEQKLITTTGDSRTAMPLDKPTSEGAGLFTKQLEEALLSCEIDIAVHSLKDLPVETPPGLVLAAILPRAPIDDLLISKHAGGLAGLPAGASVGSSSPRRALLLKNRRQDLQTLLIRGNVPTRLAKVANGEHYDATILAAAGLHRLGHNPFLSSLVIDGITLSLERLDWMLPSPGQGAIAVETRDDDPAVQWLSPLHDAETASCVETERLLLKHMGGGCHLALGALAIRSAHGVSLRAVYVPDELSAPRFGEALAETPAETALLVANQLRFP